MTIGSSVCRSFSRTISAPTWEVAGQCTEPRVSPGWYGRTPLGSPTPAGTRIRAWPDDWSARAPIGPGSPGLGATCQGRGRATSTSLDHHNSPNGAQEATSTRTVRRTPRRSGVIVTSTARTGTGE